MNGTQGHIVAIIVLALGLMHNSYYTVAGDEVADVPDGMSFTTSNCTSDKFGNLGFCQIECTVKFDATNNYTNYESGYWLYYTTDIDHNITLQSSLEPTAICSQPSDNATEFKCSLLLSKESYYAGSYRCVMTFTNDSNFQYDLCEDFKVDTSNNGSLLNEPCATANDCLTLDSTCSSDSVCICTEPADVPYDATTDNNPACLKRVNLLRQCYVEDQCYRQDEARHCMDGTCLCQGGVFQQGEDYICRSLGPLWSPCTYNQDCIGGYNYTIDTIVTFPPGVTAEPIPIYAVHNATTFCNTITHACDCWEGNIATNNLLTCKASSLTLKYETCTVDSFTNSASCNLTCSIDLTDTGYTFLNYSWTYVLNAGLAIPLQLFNGGLIDNGQQSYTTYLPLADYYAGYYVCHFNVVDSSMQSLQLNSAFKISPTTEGSTMDQPCNSPSDCSLLNAQCDAEKCNCSGTFYIPYLPNGDRNPGCLQTVDEGATCVIDDECTKEDQYFKCVDNRCTCLGEHMTVEEEDNQNLCLLPGYLAGACKYSEQCQKTQPNSVCIGGGCTCADGYEMNDARTDCDKMLTGGEIAGIVIGSICGAAIIVAGIAYMVMKRNRKG